MPDFNSNIKKIFIIAALLLPCFFIEACSCSCSDAGKSVSRTAGSIEKSFLATRDDFKTAFEAYLDEKKILSSKEYKSKLIEISKEQKQTINAFKMKEDNPLLEDSTGKFQSLAPLVRENKIAQVIVELKRIMNENTDNEMVMLEGHRKLSICYFANGDTLNYNIHNSKYISILDSVFEKKEKEEIEILDDITRRK